MNLSGIFPPGNPQRALLRRPAQKSYKFQHNGIAPGFFEGANMQTPQIIVFRDS